MGRNGQGVWDMKGKVQQWGTWDATGRVCGMRWVGHQMAWVVRPRGRGGGFNMQVLWVVLD